MNSILTDYAEAVQHVLVFHDEFYISSSLPHEDIQPLYSYLVGCGESFREQLPAGACRPLKVHTYKEAGTAIKIRKDDE